MVSKLKPIPHDFLDLELLKECLYEEFEQAIRTKIRFTHPAFADIRLEIPNNYHHPACRKTIFN
jgi:hypothetical protein